MIYRATENGFNPEDFHKKCDNKGPTILITLYCGLIIGYYTDISWLSPK